MFKRNLKKRYKNIIFDFDDTLAPCAKFYIEAKDNFCKYQEQRTGVPLKTSERIFNSIDLACVDMPNGFNRLRYPRSFAAASAVLDIVSGKPPNEEAALISFNFGNAVFEAPYDVFPDVIHMLTEYHSKHNIFLWTKGDEGVQRTKVVRNGLEKIFGWENIHVVMNKTPEGFADMMRTHKMVSKETLMVGDSVKDDVGCALANKVDVVLIIHDGQKWGYEDKNHTPTYALNHVTELINIIPL